MQHPRTPSRFPPTQLRAADFAEFMTQLQRIDETVVVDSTIHETTFRNLYTSTSGWVFAAYSVLHGARVLDTDIHTTPPDRYPYLLSTEALSIMRGATTDSASFRLTHVLSFLHRITPETLTLAVDVVPRIGIATTEMEVEGDLLVPGLVENGYLIAAEDTSTIEFGIPPVLRSIARRLLDHLPGHNVAKTRRAIGHVFAEALHSAVATEPSCFEEILHQSADNGRWDVLIEVWAERGQGLYFHHLETAAEVYSSVPLEQARTSPMLAEALSFAEQVNSVRRRTEAKFPAAIIAQTDLEFSSIPAFSSHLSPTEKNTYSADDLIVMIIASMQSLRHRGQAGKALSAATQGWHLVQDKERQGRGPTAHNEARFSLQRGITALSAGRWKEATQDLRKAVLIAESTLPTTPYLLGAAYVYSALAKISNGNGRETDDLLHKFDILGQEYCHLHEHFSATYHLTRMIRALDELDVETAAITSRRIPDPAEGHSTWLAATSYLSLLGICTGNAKLEEKHLAQVMDANESLYTEEPLLRDLLSASRVHLLLATGRFHVAQSELLRQHSDHPEMVLANARFRLAARDFTSVEELSTRLGYRKDVTLRVKASAGAIRAAALLGGGKDDAARTVFLDALEYCRLAGSLQAVIYLPRTTRNILSDMTSDADHWGALADSFADSTLTGDILLRRVFDLGETLVHDHLGTQLSVAAVDLLILLDRCSTVADMAVELDLTEGTVKNKLSKLYKTIGVRNRKAAIAFGYRNGYLPERA